MNINKNQYGIKSNYSTLIENDIFIELFFIISTKNQAHALLIFIDFIY